MYKSVFTDPSPKGELRKEMASQDFPHFQEKIIQSTLDTGFPEKNDLSSDESICY